MSPPLLVEIEEGTPAAEALKANADVRVSKLRKVGRSTKLQAGVRALKSAARTASGQPGHAGDRRGAPAFVAPRGTTSPAVPQGPTTTQTPTIPEGDDEELESDDERAIPTSQSAKNNHKESALPADGENSVEDIYDDTSRSTSLDKSLDDASLDVDGIFQHPKSNSVSSNRNNAPQHLSHVALSAQIAAACRAGEEMDRQRAAQQNKPADDADTQGGEKLSPLMSSFTNLFKGIDAMDGGSPRLSTGTKQNNSKSFTSRRRATLESFHMPSEISVAETEKHANIHRSSSMCELDDEDLSVESANAFNAAGEDDFKRKHVLIDPIVVDIPGAAVNDAVEEEEESRSNKSGEAENLRDTMDKAKKKRSMRSSRKTKRETDIDAFNFPGPKSVRKWVKKTRSKKENKELRSYVKGKVIDGEHELYTMSIAVMFGMRTSIGRTNSIMSKTVNDRRWLDNNDLMAVEKYKFPPRGSDITPPHQLNHTFKFKDYCPLAFAYLRRMFGVNEYDFLLSVCGNANYIEFQSNAKSGQFFFYSLDGKYMIKTMTNSESKFLRRIMPHYFRHCAMNPNTLVTKFLGMYRVKLYHLRRNVKFVVMKSVYDTDKNLDQLFDLKGSTTGRDAKPGDAVKKDNDVRRVLPDGAFMVDPSLRERLRCQVEKDCEWLKSMKIMDYSMLVGVHNISQRSSKSKSNSQLSSSRPSSGDGDDLSNSSVGNASNATLDRFLDVDDDDSYLEGAIYRGGSERKMRPPLDTSSLASDLKSSDYEDESVQEGKLESEARLEKAIEDMYWPFQQFYDIHGLRRMKPIKQSLIAEKKREDGAGQTCAETDDRQPLIRSVFGNNESGRSESILLFEKPLSDRKDGGFMMDTSRTELPMKLSVPGAPHSVDYCDGKIFYMGIIDILQQFNIRKRGEARYRRLGGRGWQAASCVHPTIYADRFLRFFDEYTNPGDLGIIKEEDDSIGKEGESKLSERSSALKLKSE